MGLAIDRVVSAEQLIGVSIVQLHRNAAWSMAVACSIDQVDPVKLGGVSPAGSVVPGVTVIHHVTHREVGFDGENAILSRAGIIALWNIIFSGQSLSLPVYSDEVLMDLLVILLEP